MSAWMSDRIDINHGDCELDRRAVGRRLIGSADAGLIIGLGVGMELVIVPGRGVCFLLPFVFGLVWGLILGMLSLVGAGIYGLRCLWAWLRGRR